MFGLISAIVSMAGIYGFYTNNFILLYIGAAAYIIDTFIELAKGTLTNLNTTVVSLILAVVFHNFLKIDLVNCICLFLCFESTIMYVFGLFMILFLAKKEATQN